MIRVLRHYAPVVVGAAVVALVIALVPSTIQKTSSSTGPISGVGPIPPPPDAPGSSGVAVSGVHCGPDVRQVPWSKYSPICQPAFHGTNGGSTSTGVTKTTITLTYREATSPEQSALKGLVGPSLLPTQATEIALIQSYISIFNKNFELYGRKVVLKPFRGKGDFITEDDGQGEAQAEQDAEAAKSMGAFVDLSELASTPPYMAALKRNGIIAIGGILQSTAVMQSQAPYDYQWNPTCNRAAAAGVQIIGKALSGKDAVFAGDPSLHSEKRVFGLLSPNSASYTACSGILAHDLTTQFHLKFAVDVHYPLNLTGGAALAANTTAQLKSAGVTTVLCSCDPVTPIYLTTDANAIGYHPEWFDIDLADAYNRLPKQTQWAHDLAGGIAEVPRNKDEAYNVYRLVHPTGPIVATYDAVYAPLLLMFDALQAAGPDLTAQNFARGVASLPPSLPAGIYGPWKFGSGTVSPAQGFQLMWWDPTGINPEDGLKGVYKTCNKGRIYGYDGTPSLSSRGQPHCFGR